MNQFRGERRLKTKLEIRWRLRVVIFLRASRGRSDESNHGAVDAPLAIPESWSDGLLG